MLLIALAVYPVRCFCWNNLIRQTNSETSDNKTDPGVLNYTRLALAPGNYPSHASRRMKASHRL